MGERAGVGHALRACLPARSAGATCHCHREDPERSAGGRRDLVEFGGIASSCPAGRDSQ